MDLPADSSDALGGAGFPGARALVLEVGPVRKGGRPGPGLVLPVPRHCLRALPGESNVHAAGSFIFFFIIFFPSCFVLLLCAA